MLPVSSKLPPVIFIDEEKCINCHACIAACPVKFCNDGSGDHVTVNNDTCIGCGRCLSECTHDARRFIDDFERMQTDLADDEDIVAIVAPSIAANFPRQTLNFNGWLKSLGVDAVFDVSFGAELSTKSYVEYITKNKPDVVITQPCPAIVTYIELYLPELLPYLAPVDSPMMHTIKMIRRYYPQYEGHKIAVISPCIAKKREFAETGAGDYIIGYSTVRQYLDDTGDTLERYPATDFDNPDPERAVIFSTPGGLLRTLERWVPDIRTKTRKTEGNPGIYEYLKKLPDVIKAEKGMAPLLIDCLSCDMGCNGGPLTLVHDKSPDEIEYWVEKRSAEMRERYAMEDGGTDIRAIEKIIDEYWEDGLYNRNYIDLSQNADLKIPNEEEKWEIFRAMHKNSQDDIYNCSSCGYGRCENMAVAIFNGLNRPENCHHFLSSDREMARQKIIENEKRLKTILVTSIEGFMQVDTKENIIDINPAMASILGLPEDAVIGRSIFDFVDDNNAKKFRAQLQLRSKNIAGSYEVSLFRPDGSRVDCIFHATPLLDENGIRIGSFAMVSDITELKRAEEELRRHRNNLEKQVNERTKELDNANKQLIGANKKLIELDRVKSDFVSSVSHELRTPLTSVLGFAKIIQKRMETVLLPAITSDDPKVLRAIRQIGDNINIIVLEGERLTKMINDVLDLAKMEAGKLEWDMKPISAADIIERSIASTSSLFNEKGIDLITEIESDLPLVCGDTNRLIQVVVNLLSNAVKFTGEGTVTCKAALMDSEIHISVIDTGVGISKRDSAKMFNKFKQVGDTLTDKPKGTGLGLVISKEIIEYHNGQIWFDSEPGKGSTFTFSLPVSTAASPKVRTLDKSFILQHLKDHAGKMAEAQKDTRKKILVVDDDRHIREFIRQELEANSYTIVEAKDGFAAVEQVREQRPDLIVLDIMMPGMSGFDVSAVVKNDPLTMGITIIILSVMEERERGERLGVERYFTKPVNSVDLASEIDVLLHQENVKKKVIVVDKNVSLVKALSEIMRAQGYTVAEAFNGSEFMEKAREIKPDIVIADAEIADSQRIVNTLRFEKGMENVLFLLLGGKNNDSKIRPNITPEKQ